MDRMEIARVCYGYDPETTPQLEVERAEEWLGRFTWEVDYLTEMIESIEGNEIYQGFDCPDDEVVIVHRPIEKITAKQVWLADTRLYPARRLPRYELEMGEVWREHKTYGFGRHLRSKLQQKLAAARNHQIAAQEEVEFLRSQMATGGIVLSESILVEIEQILASLQEPAVPATVNWRQEGF